MKRIPSLFLFLILGVSSFAQVGVGKTNPDADVDIASVTATEPSLGLEPKVAPVGTATGQITVIGDQLYMYDAVRTTWLTVGGVALQFGRDGSVTTGRLFMGGDVDNANTGYAMPFDGRVVAATVMLSSNVSSNKRIQFRVRDIGNNTISNTNLEVPAGTNNYMRTNLNVSFSQGDYLSARARYSGVTAEDPVLVLWVKWTP